MTTANGTEPIDFSQMGSMYVVSTDFSHELSSSYVDEVTLRLACLRTYLVYLLCSIQSPPMNARSM